MNLELYLKRAVDEKEYQEYENMWEIFGDGLDGNREGKIGIEVLVI